MFWRIVRKCNCLFDFNFLHIQCVNRTMILSISVCPSFNLVNPKKKKLICHYWNWSGTNQSRMCYDAIWIFIVAKVRHVDSIKQSNYFVISYSKLSSSQRIKSGTNHVHSDKQIHTHISLILLHCFLCFLVWFFSYFFSVFLFAFTSMLQKR